MANILRAKPRNDERNPKCHRLCAVSRGCQCHHQRTASVRPERHCGLRVPPAGSRRSVWREGDSWTSLDWPAPWVPVLPRHVREAGDLRNLDVVYLWVVMVMIVSARSG